MMKQENLRYRYQPESESKIEKDIMKVLRNEEVQVVHSPVRTSDLSHKRNGTLLIGPRTPDKSIDSNKIPRPIGCHPMSDLYEFSGN